jgi:hypothetical protein
MQGGMEGGRENFQKGRNAGFEKTAYDIFCFLDDAGVHQKIQPINLCKFYFFQ